MNEHHEEALSYLRPKLARAAELGREVDITKNPQIAFMWAGLSVWDGESVGERWYWDSAPSGEKVWATTGRDGVTYESKARTKKARQADANALQAVVEKAMQEIREYIANAQPQN
jgi:hypothetical protein